MRSAFGLLAVFLAHEVLASQPVQFSEEPKVIRQGTQSVIVFAVAKPTDVEVAVLDRNAKVIRHLAAGVLGGKEPPPAPLKAGLKQRIEWDGEDDLGKPAKNGPFSVRIRLGMSVDFGRMIGGSPYTGTIVGMPYRAPVNGLAVDAKGELIIKMQSSVGSHGNSGLWPWHIRRFDRQGKYVKTILPYPPSTDAAKASGFQLLRAAGFTPANQNSLYPVFYVFGNELVPRVVDNQLVFIHSEKRELNFFKLDGSNEATTVPLWSAKAKVNCPRWLDIQVAISPDGRYAYLSNVAGVAYDGKKPEDIDPNWPQGRIYRKDLKQPDRDPEPFYDLPLPDFSKTPYWMPSAWDKKTAAAGIDVDADGHVFVGDLVNHEVVEISPEGKRVSAVKVPWPDKVMVSRRTGTLYVISRKVSRGQLPPAKLSKITGRGKDAKIVAELQLEGTIGGAYTLDESGKAPVLWLAGSVDGTDRLVRVEDRGNNFVITGDRFLNADANAIAFVGYLDVDAEAELVYVTRSGDKIWRFDGRTGQGGLIPIKAVDLAIGRNGMIYTWGTGGYQGPIARYSRDLKPAPLASGEHTYGYLYGRAGRGASVCGIDVDLLGRVFATWGTNRCFVLAYDAEGKPVPFKRKAIMQTRKGPEEVPVAISGVAGYGGSLRVDYQGNLYLLQKKLPKDFHPPKEWAKDEAYRHAVGTIYKFPPEGGEVHADNSYRVKEVVGAVRAYPDCGPISQWRCAGSCACTKPRFDVDGYGRLYIPNGITFRVSVRDNNNNEIVGFGGYGNLDCQGPKSNEPSPSIPLGWPVAVGASDDFIYVGDCLNHRVVRVDKKFAAVRSVPIK